MTSRRDDPIALEASFAAVADKTGIPQLHIAKDFWVTEALRALMMTAQEEGVTLIFKGGTSLSKGYKLIQRFSEDIDLLVLADGDDKEVHRVMRIMHKSVESHLGVEAEVDGRTSTTGLFRPALYAYPGQHLAEGAEPETIRVELSTWGGALPHEELSLRSILTEAGADSGLIMMADEDASFRAQVLCPERTLVEKLAILHDAAETQDERRQVKTARHYYDVCQLLNNADVRERLQLARTSVLANEVYKHNTATKSRAGHKRPAGGFANSSAFRNRGPNASRNEYESRVMKRYIFPNADKPSFDECLATVERYRALL